MEVRARLSLAWRKDVRVDYCLEFKVRKGSWGRAGGVIADGVEARPVYCFSANRHEIRTGRDRCRT